VIPPRDETEARAKAFTNACDLVDKLKRQSAELEADPRYADGAGLARSALAAALELRRLLGDSPSRTVSPEISNE
jgi:hypothetical protein